MSSKIMFSNLRAEMARENITIQDIAKVLNRSRETVSLLYYFCNKSFSALILNKSRFLVWAVFSTIVAKPSNPADIA